MALSEIDDGLRALRGSAQQLSGSLRIGVTHTFNVSLLPTCIDIFFRKNPSVRVTVQEQNAESVGRGVEGGEFDIGIAYRPNNRRGHFVRAAVQRRDGAGGFAGASAGEPQAHPDGGAAPAKPGACRRATPPRASCWTDGSARSARSRSIVVEMNPIASVLALVRRMEIGAIISRQALIEVEDLLHHPDREPDADAHARHSLEPRPSADGGGQIVRRDPAQRRDGHADGVAGAPRRTTVQRFGGTIGKSTKLSRPDREMKRGLAADRSPAGGPADRHAGTARSR